MTPKNYINTLSLIAILVFAAAASAFGQADLRVDQFQGPTTAVVRTPYQYSFRVRNFGNIPANNTKVTITLPQTSTSPDKYIMGRVSGLTSGCSVVSARIECTVGALNPGINRIITFTLEYPVTSKPLVMTAAASTTTYEVVTTNNSAQRTQTVGYPSIPFTNANMLVTSCTGRGLTAFYECELFPSSQQQFTISLNLGGTVSHVNPAYTGTWDQPTSKQLHFTFTDGVSGVEFNGYASGSNCFEGLTQFTPASTYMSAYRVCIQ